MARTTKDVVNVSDLAKRLLAELVGIYTNEIGRRISLSEAIERAAQEAIDRRADR